MPICVSKMMSDTESVYSEYSEYSESSDTVSEGIDTKNIMKQKFVRYKCIDCEMLKLPIKQGFVNCVCNNICQYMICDNCNKIINKIDDMKNEDIDNRNAETLDDDLEIFVFLEMNKFLTEEEFDNVLYEGDEEGNANDFVFKYYSIVKGLYNMSFSIKRLNYEACNNDYFDFLSCEYDEQELEYTERK